jgi:hypothetical protein
MMNAMNSLKKSLNNLINEQIKNLELLDSIMEVYTSSKEFQNLNAQERDLIFKLKTNQKEYLNNINKYIKY